MRGRVEKRDLTKLLDKAEKDLASASNPRQLNAVRKSLVDNFNAYAGGRPIFGPKIGRVTAEPGDYKVTVTANGESSTSYFKVREDPLKE